ncbi:MAG TPA: VWA domain-containing protein [Phycisphaerae bacterium]|nr:VWA domain-containing protein [Phycisphaerae bacterium]
MILLRHPWLLALLALIPLIWWAYFNPQRRAAIRFAGVSRLKAQTSGWGQHLRLALPILRSLAVALIILSIARPQKADEQTRVQTEGVALQLVVDRSGSMGQQDFIDAHGRRQTRLDAVKQVVRGFVEGDGERLKGRPDDLIGLIAFAHYADTESPLTHDHQHLIRALENVELPTTRDEDGTAIGDALLLAVERIRNISRRFQGNDAFQIKSRAIILLTDGEQNRGKYQPLQAAEAAAALGIKVYTIGAAPEYQEQQTGGLFLQPQTIRVPVEINEELLEKVAKATGGAYFRARDLNSLTEIYAEIDRLERSAVDEERYYLYEELAYKWSDLAGLRLPPPLLVALFLLAVEVVLANTRLRRIP